MVDKHYWRIACFLVAIILLGTAFWGLRRFNPALFLGKPDYIAVPNDDQSENQKKPNIENIPKLLNINSATAAELDTLPSIGPSMAERIILYRQENGDFTSVDDLKKVKGIGDKTLEKLKPFIDIK